MNVVILRKFLKKGFFSYMGYSLLFISILILVRIIPFLKELWELAFMLGSIFYASIATFDRRSTVTPNLSWLLLTPISRKELFIINAVLNLMKSAACLALVVLIFIFFHPHKDSVLNFLEGQNSSTFPYFVFSYLIFIIVFACCIICSISMNTSNAALFPMTSRVTVSFIEQFKFSLFPIIFCIYLGLCFSDSEVVDFYFPAVIKLAVFLGVAFYFTTTSSLNSLNVYYEKKRIKFLSSIIFLIAVLVFSLFCFRDIFEPSLIVQERESACEQVGFIGAKSCIAIKDDILNLNANIETTEYETIKRIIGFSVPTKESQTLLSSYLQECRKNQNYYCRYYAELNNEFTKKLDLDVLALGCPKDLASCLRILQKIDSKDTRFLNAKKELERVCPSKKYFVRRVCQNYFEWQKKP